MSIKKVCVIGSGVMGAGIAAHIANAEVQVLLLDIAIDNTVKDKMLKGKVPQLAHPSLASFIEIGVIDKSLEKIKSCDWVIEVIVEKSVIKGELYKKISPYIKPGAIISSNTSTLPMKELRAYFTEKFQPDFLLTHFFNPPRSMQLLEIIYDKQTSDESVKNISDFISQKLGKIIVKSHDTPGFIANRIGCFLMWQVLASSYENKTPIPAIDYVFSKYFGFPSTGIFGLFDLIGLDVMQMIGNELQSSLPTQDQFNKIYKKYDFYEQMLKDGYNGRKGKGGFYRIKDGEKEVLDWEKMDYVKLSEMDFSKDNPSDKNILKDFVAYVESLVGVISDSKSDIDLAMRLGYSWKYGPFEMKESILSTKTVNITTASPKKYILENSSSFLYEAKAGNLVISFKTKMNILNHEIFNLIIESVSYAEKNNAKKLIIYNEGKHFSAGADLKLFLEMSQLNDMDSVEKFLSLGQQANMALKYSKVPVIACAKGVALGGGCELLLHSHAVVSHLDLCAGLVEVGVGLIPGWGGVKEMVLRSINDSQLTNHLKNIILQNKTSSAYYLAHDFSIEKWHVVMNETQLLDYALNNDFEVNRSDSDLKWKVNIDLLSSLKDLGLDEHTIFIAKALQERINSASLTEESLLEMERIIFKELLVKSVTRDKIGQVVSK
jgi:3-hydroxyacyl-CoA dehydrogenase/enoyl-CoA hydratase/3-hydroxybutyryl-CoA epimerase